MTPWGVLTEGVGEECVGSGVCVWGGGDSTQRDS